MRRPSLRIIHMIKMRNTLVLLLVLCSGLLTSESFKTSIFKSRDTTKIHAGPQLPTSIFPTKRNLKVSFTQVFALWIEKKQSRDCSACSVSMVSKLKSLNVSFIHDMLRVQLFFVLALLAVESSSEIFVRLPQQLIYGSTPQFVSTRKSDQV